MNWPQSRFSARYLSYNGHYRGLRSLSQLIGQSTRCSLKMMLEKSATAQPPTITAVKCVGPAYLPYLALGVLRSRASFAFPVGETRTEDLRLIFGETFSVMS